MSNFPSIGSPDIIGGGGSLWEAGSLPRTIQPKGGVDVCVDDLCFTDNGHHIRLSEMLTMIHQKNGIQKDQLAIDSSMKYTEAGWTGNTPNRKLLYIDGSTANGQTKFYFPVHLLSGKAVGWGIDKSKDAIISPSEWTLTGTFGGVGLSSYISVETEGSTANNIRYMRYGEIKPVQGGNWKKIIYSGFEDNISTGSPNWGSTLAIGDTKRLEPNMMVRSVIEFMDPVPSDFKLFIKENTHPQYNRIMLPTRNCEYVAADVGQDF